MEINKNNPSFRVETEGGNDTTCKELFTNDVTQFWTFLNLQRHDFYYRGLSSVVTKSVPPIPLDRDDP